MTFKEATSHVQEGKWKKINKFESGAGDRYYYKCPRSECRKKCYIHCNPINNSADLYLTEGDHHHNDREIRGLSKECRIEVERLYDLGITVPTNILAHLRKINLAVEKSKLKNFLALQKRKKSKPMVCGSKRRRMDQREVQLSVFLKKL